MTDLSAIRARVEAATEEGESNGKQLLDAILSLTDPSNWDALRGAQYRGYHDAMTAVLETATEYQTGIYAEDKVLAHAPTDVRALLALVERQREALLRLANAADCVGVRFFDTDTMEPEVSEMQAATLSARALLEE